METLTSGIVASTRRGSGGNDFYTIINKGSAVTVSTNIALSLMESVDVAYDESFKAISVQSNGTADKAIYDAALSALVGLAGVRANAKEITFGQMAIKDGGKLISALADTAESLLRSYVTGAPLIVRFHNDGDGSTGALSLYRALLGVDSKVFAEARQSSWFMNKSIAYIMESAYADSMMLNQYSSVERPVLLITDFGTSEESRPGIDMIKEKANVIWIDHHLPYAGFAREGVNYINSWDFGSDSNMTAGALTSLFAQAISGADYGELIRASFISDYSKYADSGDTEAVKLATLLDYMTAKNRNGITPKQMEAVISDKEKYSVMFATARDQMDEALELGINSANKYRSSKGIEIFVVDFSPIAEKDQGFPLPGRYSSKLQGRLEELNGERVMTVVHFGNFISMRVSKAVSAEVDILGVIERLKVSSEEIGGGGHAEAASIRVQKTNLKDALRLLLAELGAL